MRTTITFLDRMRIRKELAELRSLVEGRAGNDSATLRRLEKARGALRSLIDSCPDEPELVHHLAAVDGLTLHLAETTEWGED